MTISHSQLDVHAREHYIPVLVDNVFTGNPFLAKVLSKNQVKIKGGTHINVPILYGKTKSGSFDGLDKFDINPVSTRTLAEWDWKLRYANITIVGSDLAKAAGDQEGTLDMLATEMKVAEMTIRDDLSTDLFADGTGNNSKDFDGLDNAIGTGTYGGFSSTDISTWASYVSTTGGAITISRVKEFMGQVTYGNEVTDLLLTTQTLYDALWAQAQPSQRSLAKGTPLAELGFSGIQIDNAQILVDRHCPSGYMFGVNTDYWYMYMHPDVNFYWTGNKELIDAYGYVRQIILMGNYICTARRYQFKASGLTA